MNQIEQTINQPEVALSAAGIQAAAKRDDGTSVREFNKKKIIYWIGIILLSLLFFTSGFFEVTRNLVVWDKTITLGYPPYFIVLLGIAKISGVIVLLIPDKLNWLKEWVFAGLFYDVVFAFASNYAVADLSDCVPAAIAFILIFVTYIMFRKINPVLEISFR